MTSSLASLMSTNLSIFEIANGINQLLDAYNLFFGNIASRRRQLKKYIGVIATMEQVFAARTLLD